MNDPRSSKAPRRSVREESRAVYRQAILEAAVRVFGSTGFRDAKIADIASEAGVATGTLYNYFSSKEEIFQSILEDGREQMRARVSECVAIVEPLERLRSLLRCLLEFLEEHGALFAIYVQLGTTERHTLRQADDPKDDEFRHLLLGVFEQAIVDAGARMRRDLSPDLLAVMLGGLLNGMIMRWIDGQYRTSLRDQSETIVDFFLHGATSK